MKYGITIWWNTTLTITIITMKHLSARNSAGCWSWPQHCHGSRNNTRLVFLNTSQKKKENLSNALRLPLKIWRAGTRISALNDSIQYWKRTKKLSTKSFWHNLCSSKFHHINLMPKIQTKREDIFQLKQRSRWLYLAHILTYYQN